MVEKIPTLVVCGFVFLIAIHSFFTGLLLQTILWKNKQDFEMNLIRLKKTIGVILTLSNTIILYLYIL